MDRWYPVDMDVLFVHVALPGVPFSTSIAALSAWLERAGHRTGLLVVRKEAETAAIQAALQKAGPRVVAFSFMTCTEDWVRELVGLTRQTLPAVRIIAGGPHPTTYPEQTLESFDVDAICVGEGEEPLRRWLRDPSVAHPGILRRGEGDVLVRWWVPSPDDLPDWNRGLFGDVRNHGNRFERAVGVALSRGFCPFTCTFCGVDAYRRVNKQPTSGAMRLRSVPHVLAELERARDAVPCDDGFAAWDEILPLQRRHVQTFFEGYAQRIGLPFAAQLRIEQITPALVDAMVMGGCDYVVIGLECGNESYRAKYLDKRFTNAQALQALTRLHDAGIEAFVSMMIGLPFETPRLLADTIRLARQLPGGELSWKFYTPERGTRLHALCQQHDLLIPEFIDSPFGGSAPMIRMPNASTKDISRAMKALQLLRRTQRGTFEQPRATAPAFRPALELRHSDGEMAL